MMMEKSTSMFKSSGTIRLDLAESDLEQPGLTGEVRRFLHGMLTSQRLETCLSLIICLNIIVIIIDTNSGAECVENGEDDGDCSVMWLTVANTIFLLIYTVELLARAFTYRSQCLTDPWVVFDGFVVATGWFDMILFEISDGIDLPAIQVLRLFRIARLLRALRVLRKIPELYSMIRGFFSAMNAMFWGFMIILLLLMMWSILTVEIVHPINSRLGTEGWCKDAFGSVAMSMLLLFQSLVAGDSWGDCAIPIVRESQGTFFIFAGALVSIQLGFTNLILAVIVEKAAQARDEDQVRLLRQKEEEKETAQARIVTICREIDTDRDGTVTLAELCKGYDEIEDLRHALTMLDIDREDLLNLFHCMDADKNGTLSYNEITRAIHKANTTDLRSQVMLIKLQLEEMARNVQENTTQLFKSTRDDMNVQFQRLSASLTMDLKAVEDALGAPGSPSNGLDKEAHGQRLEEEMAAARRKLDVEPGAKELQCEVAVRSAVPAPGPGGFASHAWTSKAKAPAAHTSVGHQWDEPQQMWGNVDEGVPKQDGKSPAAVPPYEASGGREVAGRAGGDGGRRGPNGHAPESGLRSNGHCAGRRH